MTSVNLRVTLCHEVAQILKFVNCNAVRTNFGDECLLLLFIVFLELGASDLALLVSIDAAS